MTRSLKARALQWLAQREQSRVELRRKLLRAALADDAAAEAGSSAEPVELVESADSADSADSAEATDASTTAARVDALLDWLEAHRFLSPERFVESRVHARAARFGNLRIRQELQQHQVALPADTAQALADSELGRARAVRQRKFGAPPSNATERARQARFLAGRGFTLEVIARALRRPASPDADEDAADA